MNSLNTLKYDLISIISYCLLVTFGIINIHSSSFNESFTSIFDSSTIVGKQIIFLIISSVTFVIIIFTKNNVFDRISPLLYFASIILLLRLFIFGVERGGAKSWYLIGPISFQPTELAKLSTALFLAKFLSIIQTDLNKTREGEFRKNVNLKVIEQRRVTEINMEKLGEYAEIVEKFVSEVKKILSK